MPITLTNIDERGHYPAIKAMIQADGKWEEDPAYFEASAQAREEIHQMVAEQLAKTQLKEVFVFVHGYNNTLADGAFRAAEIWHYTGREGMAVLYSWPAGSKGLLKGYTRDRESSEFTVPHLKMFLKTLASCPDVEKIHLIAHSRGTDVALSALCQLHILYDAAGKDTREQLKLGQMILAAPDIDLDVALEKASAERAGHVPERFTLYVSPAIRQSASQPGCSTVSSGWAN